jgi:hypothetical protein
MYVTVLYNLKIAHAIASWKANKVYYKWVKSQYLEVYRIDAMVAQRYCLQNRFIDSRPLTHPHSK